MEKLKVGFVSIVGRPNVGKSTLINNIVNQKISIVTHKTNTTRNQIIGIFNDEDSQIIFIDTPGYFQNSKSKLEQNMQTSITNGLLGTDIILYLIPFYQNINESIQGDFTLFKNQNAKKYLILTKIDKAKSKNDLIVELGKIEDTKIFDKIIPISALSDNNVLCLIKEIKQDLKNDVPYYDRNDAHVSSDYFIVAELIREKILINLNNEVPHKIFVKTTDIEKKSKIISIRAEIYLDKTHHKKLVIGKDGQKLKIIGQEARLDLEKHFNKKIYLDLFVKVRKDWMNKESIIT
ncbi:MAG: GTPase Era [Mycoplasmataceae bacterium]|nr:GTPase Era [Mycoplasmataceae bacterium]